MQGAHAQARGRQLRLRILVACAVGLVALAAWGCSNHANQASGPPVVHVDVVHVDVVVYGTQTSGIAAVREISEAAPNLRVAVISPGDYLESPLAQGLCVEDARNIGEVAGGMYAEWRAAVVDHYQKLNLKPYTPSGRFAYQPQVASQILWSYLRGPTAKNVQFISGSLVAAGDSAAQRWVEVRVNGSQLIRLETTYLVDASVEADLARLLGAGYRVGRAEDVYNDVTGPTPPFPGPADNYATAPQRFSSLLTLKLYPKGDAPRLANLRTPDYDPSSYSSLPPLSPNNVAAFKSGWSLNLARLPGGERELNETWTDYPDVGLAFQWVFNSASRATIFRKVLDTTINKVRYLQEHGYPDVGIANLPQTLYVREGPRVQGLSTYAEGDILSGTSSETVALGCYAQYDRHDIFVPNQIDTTRFVHVPMGALMTQGHPWLLISTAVSTDFNAYSSAIRMEATRANLGGAAGAIVTIANQLGVASAQVSYPSVQAQLLARGYKL